MATKIFLTGKLKIIQPVSHLIGKHMEISFSAADMTPALVHRDH